MDLTDKQIRICDLLCRRFAALDQQISLVPYESLVANPASLLAACGIKTSAGSRLGRPSLPPTNSISRGGASPGDRDALERARGCQSHNGRVVNRV
jgi:hypothetical protein